MPFTIEQFLGVFERYNLTVWPLQVVFVALAVAGLVLAIKRTAFSDKFIGLLLAFFWIWIGIVYQLMFFTSINKAAYLFGVLYILQGGLFLYAGVFKSKISFKPSFDLYGILGGVFIIYALVIYPLIGSSLGHAYPRNPTFGLPCPTTIFTFGMLLWAAGSLPKYLLIIPLVWSVLGFSAATSLGIREDIGLLVAGIAGTILIMFRKRATASAFK